MAGYRLGGIASGLAYAGGNTFLAMPDHGPNAKPYKASVDDTVSFIARFQSTIADPKKLPGDPTRGTVSNPNQIYVFAFDDDDLTTLGANYYPPVITELPDADCGR